MALRLATTTETTATTTTDVAAQAAMAYRAARIAADEAKARLALCERELLTHASMAYDEALDRGVHGPVRYADGTATVTVSYADRFRSLPASKGEDLRATYGALYSMLFEEVSTVKLAKNVTLDELREACGDVWADVAGILDIKEQVKPAPGAGKALARLVKSGDPLARDYYGVVSDLRYTPSIRAK